MIGALMGMIAALAIERALGLRVILRVLGFSHRHWKDLAGLGKFAAASGMAAFAAFLCLWVFHLPTPLLRLLAGGSVFGAVYLASVLLMRLLDPDERDLVNRYSQRLFRTRLLA